MNHDNSIYLLLAGGGPVGDAEVEAVAAVGGALLPLHPEVPLILLDIYLAEVGESFRTG